MNFQHSQNGNNYTGFSMNPGGQQQGQQGQQNQQQGQQPVVQPAAPAPAPAPMPQAAAPAPPTPPAPPAPMPVAPHGAHPAGGQAAQGGQSGQQPLPPGFDPNYVFGSRMANFTTTVVLPAHQLQFDEAKFLNLLAGSISLTKEEKKKILDSIPKLRQQQVDELMRIFTEEREKFVELSPKHGPQLKKLEDEHLADWKDIEMEYKSQEKAKVDEDKADDIRKQLGL